MAAPLFALQTPLIAPDEVPRNLAITPPDMLQRRYFAMDKWACAPRPQYSSSCGMSAVCAVWNYLYSSLGGGIERPLAVEEVGELLGFEPPLRKHGLFYIQTNSQIMTWFQRLCELKHLPGTSRILFKLQGSRKTSLTPDTAFWQVASALRTPSQALVYHCESHFMTLVGYEVSPQSQTNAYSTCSEMRVETMEPWVIAAETNGKKQPLHSIRWQDVVTDLSLLYPAYLDVRSADQGVREHRSALYTSGEYAGRNIHCIMVFDRVTA